MGRPEERLARRGGAVEFLRIPSALFAGLSDLRNALYDRGLLPVARVDVPVVCVGNLSVGGTGKTPMVALVAHALQARGLRPGVLSRGYGRGEAEENDEALLLARVLPDVPHVQDADRVRGARALAAGGVDAIVLDDGFQHRRLARDLDLVLIDATRPWGLPAPPDGGAPVRGVLPRGLLRERPRGLARAHAAVLTRCEQVPRAAADALADALQAVAPGVPVLRAEHRPRALREDGLPLTPDALRGRKVRLVSGIGNPQAFERTARALGAEVLEVHAFPDHHAFTPTELAELCRLEGELCVTEKDAVKLEPLGVPCLVLEVELAIVEGAAVFDALLDALPPGRARAQRLAIHEGLHG